MVEAWVQICRSWDPCKVNMASQKMRDADVDGWCGWFARDYLPAVAPRPRFLTEFDFSNNFISDAGMQILLRTLIREGIRVRTLKAFGNKLASEVVFVEYVNWSVGALRALHLSDNLFRADAVSKLYVAVVKLTDDQGSSCYPTAGKSPFWLRIGGGSRPSYDSKAVETSLREGLSSIGRSLAKDVHVTDDTDRDTCNTRICCRTSPTPAVHAPYLFPHWKKQVPCSLKQVNESGSISLPPIVTETSQGHCLDMSRRAIRDEDLPQYFNLMEEKFRHMKSGGQLVRFKEVDMSMNRLTTEGLVRVIRFLKKHGFHMDVLKLAGNSSVHGEDVDFTLLAGGYGVKESKRCPLRTEGCTCGRNCEKYVEPDLLMKQWQLRISVKEGKVLVDMSNQGIDDVGMHDWCVWFSTLGVVRVQFASINFSVNYLTCDGVQELFDTFTKLNIKVQSLKLYKNKICLDHGGPIQQFVLWNCGALAELHLSQNQITGSAIVDVLSEAIHLKDDEGKRLYPVDGRRPLWFRADHNAYDSKELEEQLREALSSTGNIQGHSLDTLLCNVTHAMECTPHKCKDKDFEGIPAVHGVYLFSHWERDAVKGYEQTQDLSRLGNCVKMPVGKAQLQSALHALRGQIGSVSATQPHMKPVLNTAQQVKRSAPPDAECPGFLRPQAAPMRVIAGGSAISGTPKCFTPQTLFCKAIVPHSYVSAGELRRGDRLVGPGEDDVLVVSVQKHPKKLRNMVRIRTGHSAAAFVLTSDHRVQVDPAGTSLSAGRICQNVKDGSHPVVYDGNQVHLVIEATRESKREAVIEVKFAGDDVAFVWLRPRRWRSQSADCPKVVVRGGRLDSISLQFGAATQPEEQERRYGFTCRSSFVDDFQHSSGTASRRSSSVPPRAKPQ